MHHEDSVTLQTKWTKIRRVTIMNKAAILAIILYDNAQKAKELACDTKLDMERCDLVAEGNDNEGNDDSSEVEGNELDNNEHGVNVQEKYDAIQSHVDQT